MTPCRFVPGSGVGPGRGSPDPTRVAARADPLEVGDTVEDRPIELGQVLGKGGGGLGEHGSSCGEPGLHHDRPWAIGLVAGTGNTSGDVEAKVPIGVKSVP